MEKWADAVSEDILPFDYLSTRGDNTLIPELKRDPQVKRIVVDCPGFMDVDPEAERSRDPLGHGAAADALRAVLDVADRAIVPINPEWLSFDPTEYTIERVLRPRGIPFLVVINRWDPRDGEDDLVKVQNWIDEHGYPRPPKPIRKYKIHANAAEKGLVVTQYAASGTALRAREDFYKLAIAVDGMEAELMGRRREGGKAAHQLSTAPESVPNPYEAFSDSPILVDTERRDLAACEAAIDGLRLAFWAAGKALQTIRDARLYRATHATFEDYVETRWQMSRAQAYRLIQAWPLAETLSPIGDTALNEAQVRALIPIATQHGGLSS